MVYTLASAACVWFVQSTDRFQAASKAQSLLGMINKQFIKIIDREDFGIKPASDHISNTASRCGQQSCTKIRRYWMKYKEWRLEWSEDSRNCHRRPCWRSWVFIPGKDEDLFPGKRKIMSRLDRNIQDTEWERTCQLRQIFWTGKCHQRTQRTLVEIIQTKMSCNNPTKLLQLADCQWLERAATGSRWMRRRSTCSRTSWIDTGMIWAFSTDWLHSQSTWSTCTIQVCLTDLPSL